MATQKLAKETETPVSSETASRCILCKNACSDTEMKSLYKALVMQDHPDGLTLVHVLGSQILSFSPVEKKYCLSCLHACERVSKMKRKIEDFRSRETLTRHSLSKNNKRKASSQITFPETNAKKSRLGKETAESHTSPEIENLADVKIEPEDEIVTQDNIEGHTESHKSDKLMYEVQVNPDFLVKQEPENESQLELPGDFSTETCTAEVKKEPGLEIQKHMNEDYASRRFSTVEVKDLLECQSQVTVPLTESIPKSSSDEGKRLSVNQTQSQMSGINVTAQVPLLNFTPASSCEAQGKPFLENQMHNQMPVNMAQFYTLKASNSFTSEGNTVNQISGINYVNRIPLVRLIGSNTMPGNLVSGVNLVNRMPSVRLIGTQSVPGNQISRENSVNQIPLIRLVGGQSVPGNLVSGVNSVNGMPSIRLVGTQSVPGSQISGVNLISRMPLLRLIPTSTCIAEGKTVPGNQMSVGQPTHTTSTLPENQMKSAVSTVNSVSNRPLFRIIPTSSSLAEMKTVQENQCTQTTSILPENQMQSAVSTVHSVNNKMFFQLVPTNSVKVNNETLPLNQMQHEISEVNLAGNTQLSGNTAGSVVADQNKLPENKKLTKVSRENLVNIMSLKLKKQPTLHEGITVPANKTHMQVPEVNFVSQRQEQLSPSSVNSTSQKQVQQPTPCDNASSQKQVYQSTPCDNASSQKQVYQSTPCDNAVSQKQLTPCDNSSGQVKVQQQKSFVNASSQKQVQQPPSGVNASNLKQVQQPQSSVNSSSQKQVLQPPSSFDASSQKQLQQPQSGLNASSQKQVQQLPSGFNALIQNQLPQPQSGFNTSSQKQVQQPTPVVNDLYQKQVHQPTSIVRDSSQKQWQQSTSGVVSSTQKHVSPCANASSQEKVQVLLCSVNDSCEKRLKQPSSDCITSSQKKFKQPSSGDNVSSRKQVQQPLSGGISSSQKQVVVQSSGGISLSQKKLQQPPSGDNASGQKQVLQPPSGDDASGQKQVLQPPSDENSSGQKQVLQPPSGDYNASGQKQVLQPPSGDDASGQKQVLQPLSGDDASGQKQVLQPPSGDDNASGQKQLLQPPSGDDASGQKQVLQPPSGDDASGQKHVLQPPAVVNASSQKEVLQHSSDGSASMVKVQQQPSNGSSSRQKQVQQPPTGFTCVKIGLQRKDCLKKVTPDEEKNKLDLNKYHRPEKELQGLCSKLNCNFLKTNGNPHIFFSPGVLLQGTCFSSYDKDTLEEFVHRLLHCQNFDDVADVILMKKQVRNYIEEKILKDIDSACERICSKDDELGNLLKFDLATSGKMDINIFDKVILEMQKTVPFLTRVLKAICLNPSRKPSSKYTVVMMFAMGMHLRNPNMSYLQQLNTCLIDEYGSAEVLNLLSKFNFTLDSEAKEMLVHRMKKLRPDLLANIAEGNKSAYSGDFSANIKNSQTAEELSACLFEDVFPVGCATDDENDQDFVLFINAVPACLDFKGIAKLAFDSKEIRNRMECVMVSGVDGSCEIMCAKSYPGRKVSVFRDDLCAHDKIQTDLFGKIEQELTDRNPFLYNVLKTMCTVKPTMSCTLAMIFAMGIQTRCTQMSYFQQLNTFLVSQDGSLELLNMLNKLHFTLNCHGKKQLIQKKKRMKAVLLADADERENELSTVQLSHSLLLATSDKNTNKCNTEKKNDVVQTTHNAEENMEKSSNPTQTKTNVVQTTHNADENMEESSNETLTKTNATDKKSSEIIRGDTEDCTSSLKEIVDANSDINSKTLQLDEDVGRRSVAVDLNKQTNQEKNTNMSRSHRLSPVVSIKAEERRVADDFLNAREGIGKKKKTTVKDISSIKPYYSKANSLAIEEYEAITEEYKTVLMSITSPAYKARRIKNEGSSQIRIHRGKTCRSLVLIVEQYEKLLSSIDAKNNMDISPKNANIDVPLNKPHDKDGGQVEQPPPAKTSVPGTSDSKREPYTCKQCTYRTYHTANLWRHIKSVHRARYQCTPCICQYSCKYSLKEHTSSRYGQTHQRSVTYAKLLNRLRAQRKNYIRQKFLYRCGKCPKTFKMKKHFHDHVYFHKNIKPHKCFSCKKSFRYKSKLKRHYHTCIGTLKYQCPHCKRFLQTRSGFRNHIKCKHGQMRFICQCGHTYAWKANLVRHQKTCKHVESYIDLSAGSH